MQGRVFGTSDLLKKADCCWLLSELVLMVAN